MNRKVKKNILLVILLLAASAGITGYYFFNKGPVDVKHAGALKIAAAGLYDAYTRDSSSAKKNYTGKIIEVSGKVYGISLNSKRKKIILLVTDLVDAFINCTMEEEDYDVHPNSMVNIKGICSGIGEGDADLGIKGDVYLTRCYLTK